MAMLFSSNHIICQNPLSFKTPNFKFNQFSLQFQHNSSSFSSSTNDLIGRRCVRAFSNSGEDSTRSDDEVKDIGVKAALSMLKFYKREISPLMPNSCRYVPTCSEYSMIAYKKYGVGKGTILTAWRLCRCNPLGGSGFDPPRWFGETTPSQE
ncbi:UPF0161 protein [Salvia divinorum]|uniref:UPF0161 protein n=1 Tax=Salvia divinorum TaxID=28513 RepID=A0ABD1GRD2_SALDI